MSYRGGSNYRGPADRSRSPPRFADRRGSSANVFDARHAAANPLRSGSDAPRGPRSQFDGPPRGPPPALQPSANTSRPSLRDAPPLGSGARPFRERDYPDRRDRSPPPRERSPPRKFPEQRELPPRDIDVRSARRVSRDGPPSAGSSYSDGVPFTGSSYRGGGFRGRGRGDFEFRGATRGGRRTLDDRGGDLFPTRRERSPPPRFGRDLSRDGRDPERRDDRRFERREDERRPDWVDRERERDRIDLERSRRDPPPARLDTRPPSDNIPNASASYAATAAPPVNPERLAIIESSGGDTGLRRPSAAPLTPATQRRDPPPEPAYLNGRADAAAQRYGSRGSSPPTQAPPVPAFSFSIAPSSANNQPPQTSKPVAEPRAAGQDYAHSPELAQHPTDDRPVPPSNAPTAPKAAPLAPKAHHASPPATAPRAPRALELDAVIPPSNRLHGVRSLDNIAGSNRIESHATQPPSSMPPSPGATRHTLPHLAQPISPNPPQAPRFDISAPTGPKAVRPPVAQTSVSPRPPFTSPRSDVGAFQPTAPARSGTPPPTAPSGPRRQSFSVSPKVATSSVPTAPKAARAVPPSMPRMGPAPAAAAPRPPERPPFAPSGPRSQLQWNQWRRPPPSGPSSYPSVPAKRDSNGDEKERQEQLANTEGQVSADAKHEHEDGQTKPAQEHDIIAAVKMEDPMDVDREPAKRKSSLSHSQATTRASFFGGTLPRSEENIIDSSDEEDDELDEDEDATLLEAKHARRERELRAKLHDLSAPQFRATSPLESIARLARLSVRDLGRLDEQRADLMDVDEGDARGDVPAATHSSGSEEGPEVTTPRAAQDLDVTIRDADDEVDMAHLPRRRSPEPVSLPYLIKPEEVLPLHESDMFQETIQEIEDEEAEVEAVLHEDFQLERDIVHDAEVDFAGVYAQWREECEGLERVKEEQEKLERQLSTEPGPVPEAPLMPLITPILEGRRLHKNSSEYEIERVIRESEETARIEQERQDREAKKVQADMEKEARLPDQETQEVLDRDALVNTNRLRDPAKLLRVFSYEPPPDTFTEHEQEVFIAAFKDTPKKWGEIASLLEGRTYKDCIHHYYANKWDGRFRDNRTKKFKGGRRGRGGKASRPSRGSALMADLNRGEDVPQTTDTTTGRPKRAAAPTTFGEREIEAKGTLVGPSPIKKPGAGSNKDASGEEKPAKKQRRTGEGKPGRKGKTQLAPLAAAAPGMSPHKPPPPQPKDEFARLNGPSLEEAGLLANFQGAPRAIMQHDGHAMFGQEAMHPQMLMEDVEAGRLPVQPAKQSASSYWSVPEQTDFAKYIAHFGTDFAAIANHMGTKTQTMIKNHFQRQVDGGRADLAEQAEHADQRRARGEDMGPPPTPTPITKRKYENPQTSTPRALAPQTDAMDVDEPPAGPRPPMPHQASPPQLQTKPRYTGSAQGTPIQAQRVIPSPMPPAATPASSMPPNVPMNRGGLQHPLGPRFGLLAETRAEPRPNMQPTSMFRVGQDAGPAPPRSQPPPPQLTRTLSNAPPPEFLQSLEQNLHAEQSRAFRMQAQNEHEARMEHQQPRPHPGIPRTHGSPVNMNISTNSTAMPTQERRRDFEDRVGTPARSGFSGVSSRPALVNPNPSAGSGPQFGVSTMSALGRPYNPSPPKLETPRPGSGSTGTPLQQASIASNVPTPAPAPTPAPEPPKKSNLMSILNSEPEETKPAVKKDSLPSAATTRVASPAPPYSSAPTPQPMTNMPSARRETFGQPNAPHSQFQRGPFAQSVSTPGPSPVTLKQEPSNGGASTLQQAPKHEWQPRMSHASQPSPPAPAPLDRDPRDSRSGYPFANHRTMFSGLNPPARANPSPPPGMLGHSRTPSLTQSGPQRDSARSVHVGGSTATQPPLSSLQYGRPESIAPFSQAPPQSTNRAHHSHNNSISQGGSILERFHGGGQSYIAREEAARREEEQRAFQARMADQERAHAIQREREAYHRQAEAEQHELRHREAYSQRAPPMHHQPLSGFGSNPFSSGRQSLGGMSLRDMATRDAELAMQDHRHREQLEHERRRVGDQGPPPFGRERDALPGPHVDRYGQRPPPLADDRPPMFRRQTPQNGGGYGFPPPGPPPPGRR